MSTELINQVLNAKVTFNSLFEMRAYERAEILRTVASIVFQFSI